MMFATHVKFHKQQRAAERKPCFNAGGNPHPVAAASKCEITHKRTCINSNTPHWLSCAPHGVSDIVTCYKSMRALLHGNRWRQHGKPHVLVDTQNNITTFNFRLLLQVRLFMHESEHTHMHIADGHHAHGRALCTVLREAIAMTVTRFCQYAHLQRVCLWVTLRKWSETKTIKASFNELSREEQQEFMQWAMRNLK